MNLEVLLAGVEGIAIYALTLPRCRTSDDLTQRSADPFLVVQLAEVSDQGAGGKLTL